MTSRTLSNGTLGLRFMQNANRAKQVAQVEHQRADIHDDGKWEVSQAVKDAMGLKPSDRALSASSSDVHESSYLPFLFSDQPTASSSIAASSSSSSQQHDATGSSNRAISKGRRVFRKGEEVSLTAVQEEAKPQSIPATEIASDDLSSSKGRGPASQLARLGNASRAAGGSQRQDGTARSKPAPKNALSARDAIFASSGAGTDLGHQRQQQNQQTRQQDLPSSSKPVFMKPAGVDAPPDPSSTSTSTSNPKRDRGVMSSTTDDSIQPKKKQKKSKRTAEE